MTRESPGRDATLDNIGSSPVTGEGVGQPRPLVPRDFDMRIARDGTWHYRGSPINRKPLVKLFSSVLRREADGSYWLVTPVERGESTSRTRPSRLSSWSPAARVEARS